MRRQNFNISTICTILCLLCAAPQAYVALADHYGWDAPPPTAIVGSANATAPAPGASATGYVTPPPSGGRGIFPPGAIESLFGLSLVLLLIAVATAIFGLRRKTHSDRD